jgi:hypothetical protein
VNDDTKFPQAYQAIGEYFSEFSRLERELGEAVKVVLDLKDHPAADIVVAALRFPSTKASLVRAAVEVATKKEDGSEPAEWKAKADETLDDIIKHSNGSRNTLAHSLLEPQEDGSVKVTRRILSHSGHMTPEPEATKPLNLKDEIDTVQKLTQELRGIKDALSNLDVQVGKIQIAAAALGAMPGFEAIPLLTLREHGVPTKNPTSQASK